MDATRRTGLDHKHAYIVRVRRGPHERFQLRETGSPGWIMASLPVSQDPQHDVTLLCRAAHEHGYEIVSDPAE
jgi:hypothetical protein